MRFKFSCLKPFIVLTALLYLSNSCYGQSETGTLRASTNPRENVRLKINGVEQDVQPLINLGTLEVDLLPGKHFLEIWHPFFNVHKDTITILKDESYLYRYTFKDQNKEFTDLKLDLRKPKRRQLLTIVGAGLVNIAGWVPIIRYDKTLEADRIVAIEQLRAEYNLSTDREDILRLQESFEISRNELIKLQEDRNTKRAIGIPIMIGVNALATYLYLKNRRDFKRIEQSFRPPPPFTIHTRMSDGITVSLEFKF